MITVSGTGAVLANLSHLAQAVQSAAESAGAAAGRAILNQSNANAPTRSGAMIGSGEVVTHGLITEVGYRSEYAIFEHEKTYYHHDDGGPKFLERAGHQVDVAAAAAPEIRRVLGT